jgi:photosystem II stability/assembly factor-like uncharacterized protein
MPTTQSIAGGRGVFVGTGYMDVTVTPDFGKTWNTFSLRSFRNDSRPRKLVTHHVRTIWCGDKSGRFLAVGDDRSKTDTRFGNLFASDDLGQTWQWLEPEGLAQARDKAALVTNGRIVLLIDRAGENAFRSSDFGETWDGPHPTGTSRVTVSVVNGEFWVVGKSSRASADGRAWRDLPADIPTGQIVASPPGTLISVDRKRYDIQRSTDGGRSWEKVYGFTPETEHVHGAQGIRDIQFGYVTAKPVRQ